MQEIIGYDCELKQQFLSRAGSNIPQARNVTREWNMNVYEVFIAQAYHLLTH